MIGEIALAIEMGADEIDIGKTIHPHPTLGESIGLAAEVAHGTCTDLPPVEALSARPAPIKNPAVAAGFFYGCDGRGGSVAARRLTRRRSPA